MALVHEDIFEAIRAIDPHSPVLYLKDRAGRGTLLRRLSFEAIRTAGGDLVLMPRTGMNVMFYRGQTDAGRREIPTIYRNSTAEAVIADRVKLKDFALAVQRFPQVRFARAHQLQVDLLALAQHYGLRTDLLDLTSDITVAAFFATTRCREGVFHPVTEGVGSISCFFALPGLEADLPFHLVGLQPFQRPGKQCAFGVRLQPEEDLSSLMRGPSLRFRQNAEAGQAFLELFGDRMPNELFPPRGRRRDRRPDPRRGRGNGAGRERLL